MKGGEARPDETRDPACPRRVGMECDPTTAWCPCRNALVPLSTRLHLGRSGADMTDARRIVLDANRPADDINTRFLRLERELREVREECRRLWGALSRTQRAGHIVSGED